MQPAPSLLLKSVEIQPRALRKLDPVVPRLTTDAASCVANHASYPTHQALPPVRHSVMQKSTGIHQGISKAWGYPPGTHAPSLAATAALCDAKAWGYPPGNCKSLGISTRELRDARRRNRPVKQPAACTCGKPALLRSATISARHCGSCGWCADSHNECTPPYSAHAITSAVEAAPRAPSRSQAASVSLACTLAP